MQTVLITGSEGFIGRATTRHMNEIGFKVFTTDLKESDHSPNHRVADLKSVDCFSAFADVKPNIIIHLGAQVDVRNSFDNPTNDLMVNALGTLKLLEYGISKGMENFVYINSGGAIYGAGDLLPTSELHTDFPISPYGVTKLMGESYVRILCSRFNVNWTSLALSNCYGPVKEHGKGVIYEFCKTLIQGNSSDKWQRSNKGFHLYRGCPSSDRNGSGQTFELESKHLFKFRNLTWSALLRNLPDKENPGELYF